jgi:hypothetical protein
MQLTKRKNDDGDDYDPATLARIKTLEKGRQGFAPNELAKIKYSEIDTKNAEALTSDSTMDPAMVDNTSRSGQG